MPNFLEDRYIAWPYEGAISCYETTHETWNNVTNATASLNMTFALSPDTMKRTNATTDMYNFPATPADRLNRIGAFRRTTKVEGINWYERLYTYAFSWAMHYVIPLVFLVVLNFRVIRVLFATRNSRQDLIGFGTPSVSNQEAYRPAILNVVTVVTVFVVCQGVAWSLDICRNKRATANTLTNTFISLNCSCNFFTYFVYLKQFRQGLAQMDCCKRTRGTTANRVVV